ncbi:RDD domain containing protein [Chthoniobacter flavus Ellin428]|uniref:RDD domain containing protein n=1 Tax=Chthoniobacter flavus Ellin428 TaxID=497964 RepID=B4D160_9BACT|nr:RDD family protein [Chthoniobacter flavus]EDY20072.1 RDD domain containing protein [Chthoniobacter flavus Ellin428]TCO93969.1 putative RDD family membrane protein YckC [Chthoniobacter flavus]
MNPTLKIRTPEGIAFSFALAGPVVRCLAWIIDFLVVATGATIINKFGQLAGLVSPDLAQAIMVLSYFVFSIGYGIVLEWSWRGQTVGKRLLRLRVMDAHGLRLQFHQVLLRNLLRFVDMLPALYLVGGLASFFNRRAQRLGDLAANTVVVYNPKPAEPDLDQLLAGKFNSLRQHPHLEARLRQRVSPDEARLALQALMRRDELDPAPRVALFSELAEHFKSLVMFPAESVEAMPDEQYVRNVVDILFRTHAAEAKPASAEMARALG